MDKRTIIFFVILAIILIAYQPLMERLGLIEPVEQKTAGELDSLQVTDSTVAASDTMPVKTDAFEAAATDSSRVPADTGTSFAADGSDTISIDTVTIVTNTYTVVLSSAGGGPMSLLLNDYSYRSGEPIEMLPAAEYATPEALFAGGNFSLSRIHYVCELMPGNYSATTEAAEVVYRHLSPQGGEIVKRYTFHPDDYHYDLVVEVNNPLAFGFDRRQYDIIWNTSLQPTEPQPKIDYSAMEAVAMMGGSPETLDDFNDNILSESATGYTTWGGVREKYFAAVIIPRNRVADGFFAHGEKAKVPTSDGVVEQRQITAGLVMPNTEIVSDTFTVYVGPLDYAILDDYGVDLQDIIGIGTFPVIGMIIKPFAWAVIWLLPKLYTVFPNYGLVIIVFALLVKFITMPLSLKSFKSMAAMKDIQPKIEELRKKHKKDPQRLQAETMKLYKKHGVNPLSGCLPILLQMPLFFALFSVFRSTILLRDAPFVWFITDLSRGASGLTDPYIVLVVIMVLAQFLSQKFTMASATQQNKAFLYIMPLFMGFLFHSFAAGLVLYWTCFSLFSLIDYFVFKRPKKLEVKPAS